MPWGNRSILFRDPDGNLVNLFLLPPTTPSTDSAGIVQSGRRSYRACSVRGSESAATQAERSRHRRRSSVGENELSICFSTARTFALAF